MKILQLVTQRQYRGAEVFAAELSQLLAKNNQVVYAGLYPAPENILSAKDCLNVDLNGKKKFIDISLVKSIVRLIRKEKPDVVQANGSDTLKYAVFAKFIIPDIKIVYRNISMVSSWSATGSYKRKFNQLLFKKVDFVTSVGRQSLNDLIKTYHFPADKTQVIRRGIPELQFDKNAARKQLREKFNFGDDDFILLHIGRFSSEKNHPFLINVFRKVYQQNKNVKLVFIGEGPELQNIKESVNDLKEQIVFAGHQDEVQKYLAASDLFILGSTIEGVPGVILEAAMQSVPSVAVNVGGVSEVVINNETGIIIPDHSVEQFADAIIDLIENPNRRSQFGSAANNLVMEYYTLDRCVQQFENLYQNVISAE